LSPATTYAGVDRLRRITMAVFMGAFPVLAGKEEEPRKFARETLDRSEELDASQRRLAVTNEEWAQQQTRWVRWSSSNIVKPVSTMRIPKRLSGRRHHAMSPPRM
jgi:hypothetical protein